MSIIKNILIYSMSQILGVNKLFNWGQAVLFYSFAMFFLIAIFIMTGTQ